MEVEIELNECVGWTALVLSILILLVTINVNHHDYMVNKVKEENQTQRELTQAGYTPLEISCAYNITAPACVLLAGGK